MNCETSELKTLVGWLHVRGTKHALFYGENIIGSSNSCSVIIKDKSIDKEHAVINVDDPMYPMLADKGSQYKTRLEETILVPEQIYCIPEDGRISFGNVKATYIMLKKDNNRAIKNSFKNEPDEYEELIEKATHKSTEVLDKNKKSGPVSGSRKRGGKSGTKKNSRAATKLRKNVVSNVDKTSTNDDQSISPSAHSDDETNCDEDPKGSLICEFCGKKFNTKRKCRDHTKNVHKKAASGEVALPPCKFYCALCNRSYVQKSTLQRHVNTIHRSHDDDDSSQMYNCDLCDYKSVFKHNLKRHVSQVHESNSKEGDSKPLHRCSMCSGKYGSLRRLKYHERKKHRIGNEIRGFKRQCPLCDFTTSERKRAVIYDHYQNEHGIAISWEDHQFNSLDEFNIWKQKIENDTKSRYRKTFQSSRLTGYHCHRSGIYLKKGVGKRHLKLVGSCKINGFCPATIKVYKQESGVRVQYLPVHIGHRNELKHIRLTDEERKAVTIAAGKADLTEALNSVQDSVVNYLQWIDPNSIEAWVNTLKASTDVVLLVYKPQGIVSDAFPQLNANDFLLILMSEDQRKMLEKCGNDTIYVDSTQKLSNSDFHMCTLLVLDECREAFPTVFMFTNRMDKFALTTLFNVIKNITGVITPDVFMSDMDESFYSAWQDTMGPAKTRIFCTWRVLKDWKDNINSKIKSKETRDNVYKLLKPLLYELDSHVFRNSLDAAMTRLSTDESTRSLYDYFFECYVKDDLYKCWAYSFRVDVGISTNISLENFNKLLKVCYLRGEKSKPLEETLCAILDLLNGKLFDVINKMRDFKVVRKLDLLRRKHIASLLMDTNNVTKVESRWIVLTETKAEVTVKRIKVCKTCRLQCVRCNSCLHEFICSCTDSALKNNMCTHIHLVAQTISASEVTLREVANEEDIFLMDVDENQDTITEEIIEEEIGTCRDHCHLNKEKHELHQEIRGLEKYVYKMITTPEQIEYAKRTIKQIMTTIDSMNVAEWNNGESC